MITYITRFNKANEMNKINMFIIYTFKLIKLP